MVLTGDQAVHWLPVDVAGRIIMKTTFISEPAEGSIAYYHLDNPTPTPWPTIVEAITSVHKNLTTVPFKLWLDTLKSRSAREGDSIPAVRLIDFFEGMSSSAPRMSLERTLKAVPEVAYGELGPDLLMKYFAYQETVRMSC